MAQLMEQFELNGRKAWHYMIDSSIGEIHVVCHEEQGLYIVDDYMGRSNEKAEQKFKAVATKMVRGRA